MDWWYRTSVVAYVLWPLSLLFRLVCFIRIFLYRIGLLKTHRFPVPVIVVGNISVGGTGKTPVLMMLASALTNKGYRVGIVSKGYGGKQAAPSFVRANDDPAQFGDEAVLLAGKTACPVVVAKKRWQAVALLLKETDCNIVLSDDGLQHLSMGRSLEIVVVDGKRRFGNGFCLPAGPLREPVSRLKSVDFVLVNGEANSSKEIPLTLKTDALVSLKDGHTISLADCLGKRCHAIAGIGNPDRFFALLEAAGLQITKHVFPDHHAFTEKDLHYPEAEILLMTEKDAIKCHTFADARCYALPIVLECSDSFLSQLENKL